MGNAYLDATTEEKVHIMAGPEFRQQEGKMLVIRKDLYGLRSSGRMWWLRSNTILKGLSFQPSKVEPDIWMRKQMDHYEYIARYVDDFAIASKEPEGIISKLIEEHGLKLKGTGPITYHLGCNFSRDLDGVLCMCPRKYTDKVATGYE